MNSGRKKTTVAFIYIFLLSCLYFLISFLFLFLPEFSGNVASLPQKATASSICTKCCEFFENRVLGTVMSRQLSYRLGPFIFCGFLYLTICMTYAGLRRRSYAAFTIGVILVVFVFHIFWASWYLFLVQIQADRELGAAAGAELTLNLSQFNVVEASITNSNPFFDIFMANNSPWTFTRFHFDGMKNILMFLTILFLIRICRLSFGKAMGQTRGLAITTAQTRESIKYGLICGIILSLRTLYYAAFRGFESPETWWYGFLFFLSVIGAFLEEVLFRNIVLGGLVKRLPFWSANVINGFLFSIWHLHQNSLESHVNLFIVGCVFGFVWYRSGVIGCTIAHLTCNYCSMFLSWCVGSLIFGW